MTSYNPRTPRAQLILRSLSRTTLWLYAHAVLEWLFHATKPSIVTAAPLHIRVLMLCAAPLPLLAWLLPLEAILAGLDSLRRNAKGYWLAAVLPAAIGTVLFGVAADNFAKTMFGYALADAWGATNAVCLAVVLALAAYLLHNEARVLATPRRVAWAAVPAALVVGVSLATYAAITMSAEEPAARVATTKVALARRSNILLVGLDGVTSDHSSAYGYECKTTPTLEALAARGILYENAFSNAGRTYGSLISILTGRLPTQTHILFPPVYLKGNDSIEHLPGILRANGYLTGQIGMRHYADAYDWNMAGGFDSINGRSVPAETAQVRQSMAQQLLARYQRELTERVTSRVLHVTFIRRAEDEYRFLVGQRTTPYFKDKRRLLLAADFLQSAHEPWFLHVHFLDSHCCEGEYDRKYEAVDRTLGQLLELLRARGQLERTLIVVYSDHTHGWETLERVPLLLIPPGGTKPQRVKTNVQLADIAPTMLEHLGVPKAPWMAGQPLQHADALDPRRPIYSLIEIGVKSSIGHNRSTVRDAGPPFYGAKSAGVVVCDRWGKIAFSTSRFSAGTIAGHTAPCTEKMDDKELKNLLVSHLRANGYPVGRQ